MRCGLSSLSFSMTGDKSRMSFTIPEREEAADRLINGLICLTSIWADNDLFTTTFGAASIEGYGEGWYAEMSEMRVSRCS